MLDLLWAIRLTIKPVWIQRRTVGARRETGLVTHPREKFTHQKIIPTTEPVAQLIVPREKTMTSVMLTLVGWASSIWRKERCKSQQVSIKSLRRSHTGTSSSKQRKTRTSIWWELSRERAYSIIFSVKTPLTSTTPLDHKFGSSSKRPWIPMSSTRQNSPLVWFYR